MGSFSSDAKRVLIAGVSACAAFLFLIVFTVMVYNGKRKGTEDDFTEDPDPTVSYAGPVSFTDESGDENSVSSAEEVSSETSSEEVSSEVSSQPAETKSEAILNPNTKNQYYIVVYTETQTMTVYQKDKKGAYVNNFRSMTCSTGFNSSNPAADSVFVIQSKKTWNKFSDGNYGRYCSLLDESSELYISSVPYKQKKVSSMMDEAYAELGKPVDYPGVRLCLRDARWVYTNIPAGTQVHIFAQSGPKGDAVPTLKTGSRYKGWDPSDKWSSGNPYFQKQTTTTAASDQQDTPAG